MTVPTNYKMNNLEGAGERIQGVPRESQCHLLSVTHLQSRLGVHRGKEAGTDGGERAGIPIDTANI